MLRTRVFTAALAAAALLAGCGNERTPAPDVVTPAAPRGSKQVLTDGARFKAPFNWSELGRVGRRTGGIQSNTATMAVWLYRRAEPLPEGRAALEEAKDLLVERVRRRDPSFELRSAEVVRRAGAPGVELVGRQTIGGLPFVVRSVHLFERGAEVVLDAYARPQDFERVDATVFRPALDSLRLRLLEKAT